MILCMTTKYSMRKNMPSSLRIEGNTFLDITQTKMTATSIESSTSVGVAPSPI